MTLSSAKEVLGWGFEKLPFSYLDDARGFSVSFFFLSSLLWMR